MLNKNIYILPLGVLLLTLSTASFANENFGVVKDIEADRQIEQEVEENEAELRAFEEASSHLEAFKPEKGTFLEEDYVQPEELIEYKYDGDDKFYRDDELPENKGHLGNIIVKVPASMTKEEAIASFDG